MNTTEQPTTKAERATKQFWAIDDSYDVVCVTGYECPSNDGYWWVPELGYSLSEKHHLFPTADAGREKAIIKIEAKIAGLATALAKLGNPLPPYLDCAMCGASEAFVIDKHDPSVGYCFAEKQAWKVSATN